MPSSSLLSVVTVAAPGTQRHLDVADDALYMNLTSVREVADLRGGGKCPGS